MNGVEHRPGNSLRSDEDLAQFARAKGGAVFHPVGTCRMRGDRRSVVDARLRVIDASVMPTMTSANTNAAALLIGEKAADLVLRGT